MKFDAAVKHLLDLGLYVDNVAVKKRSGGLQPRNSSTAIPVKTVELSEEFLRRIRQSRAEANHHIPAKRRRKT